MDLELTPEQKLVIYYKISELSNTIKTLENYAKELVVKLEHDKIYIALVAYRQGLKDLLE